MELRNFYYDFLSALGILIGRDPLCGPRIAQLNISDECNLDCAMCNRSCFDVKGFMDYEKILAAIGQLYPLGLREIFFHGYGEPFLHPRIMDIFGVVRRDFPNLKQYVITNGTCISKEMIPVIKSNDVRLRFSIHAGDEETWRKIHPHDDPALFAKTREALRALNDDGQSRAEILFVLFKTNWRNIEAMMRLAGETGVKRILFRPMRFFKDRRGGIMNRGLQLDQEQYQSTREKLERLEKDRAGELSIDITPFCECTYDPAMGRPSSFDFYLNHSCYIGWFLTVIQSDGHVLGCLQESFDGFMGNINETPFRDIWWSEAYRTFRKNQLLTDEQALDRSACHSWCQHIRLNKRMNEVKRFSLRALLRRRS